ncbi:hypothetical protein GG496_002452 [Candidatus Fervidibacteria bacterium JGI MDM2 JNZ-1-D12]
MVQPKEKIDCPAIAAEALIKQLKTKFPNITVKVRPELLADEDIGVEIHAPKEIWRQVDEEAAMLSLQIELETGFFVLPFVYPQESK